MKTHIQWLVISALLSMTFISCATATHHQRAGGLHVHTFTMDYINVYMVQKGARAILIDSGLKEHAPKLAEKIKAAGVDPQNIDAIIVTHGHYDHAGGARYFQKKYNTKVVAGVGDLPQLTSGKNDKLCPTGWLARRRHHDDQQGTYSPTTPDQTINVPTPLSSLSAMNGSIIPLPGHTKGSLIVKVGEMVFVGDLFRGSIVGSAAERHFYMCDLKDNDRDIRALLNTIAPKATSFYPGHFNQLSRAQVNALVED